MVAETVRPLGGMKSDRAFYTTDLPWERAGKDVSGAKSSEDALKLAGLDWEVAMADLELVTPDGERVPSGLGAIYRTDTNTVFAASGGNYRPLQNVDMFAWTDSLVSEGTAKYVGAGSFGGGKKVWLQMEMHDDLKVAGEEYQRFFMVVNGHDMFTAFRAFSTSVRVWCKNTFNLALSTQTDGVRIIHSRLIQQRMEFAREQVSLAAQREREFADWLEAAALKPISAKTEDKLISRLFNIDLKAEKIPVIKMKNVETFREILGAERDHAGELSAYTFFNAVTGYADHAMKQQGDDEELKAERRLSSNLFGQAQSLKRNALEMIAESAHLPKFRV